MWDARFDSIKSRKLNELVIFSAMVRSDPSNMKEYEDIIIHLFNDLDVLDAIMGDKPLPNSEPILSPLYRGRLTKYESLDEFVMDECRKPDVKGIATMDEKPRIPSAEMPNMIEQPEVPQRIEPPVAQQSIEAPEVPQKIEPPVAQQSIQAPEEPQRIDSPPAKDSIEPPKELQKIDAPDEQKKLEVPEEPDKIAAPADDYVFEMVISLDDAVTLKKVRTMKDSKIDYFIDQEMDGHIKDDACEDVIAFLKTDIALINKILAINITSKTGIEESIRGIVDLVNDAEEPKHQKIYLNSLDYNEKDLEGEYNNVLRRLEGVIHDRYSYVLGETRSLFFEE